MSLLDGRYEILSRRELPPRRTLFDATAPDGSGVRIVWFELEPDEETAFERYRRALKRLKRDGHAAVYDVVSRPGARYVAWTPPEPGPAGATVPPERAPAELLAALERAGLEPSDAELRRSGRGVRVFALAFGGDGLSSSEPPAGPPTATGRRRHALPFPALPAGVDPRPWAVAAGMTLLALLLGGVAVGRFGENRLVVLPDLRGAPAQEAADALAALDLVVRALPQPSDAPEGTVVRIEPPPDSQVRPGREVRLAYALPSGRAAPVETPRLEAAVWPEEARARLSEAGLVPGRVLRVPSSLPEGVVLAQDPPAGRAAGRGGSVDLLVSDGPAETRTFLPDLTGLPLEEAADLARLAGLSPERVLIEEMPGGGHVAGTVVTQSLPPWREIPADATLRLGVAGDVGRVADGSGSAGDGRRVPRLVGLDPVAARERAAGFDVAVRELSTTSLPAGVIDQSPPPGAAAVDDALTLTVNVPPVPIPVPDVSARAVPPGLREVPFGWTIEPGIGEVEARVYARTVDGREVLAAPPTRVRGGERVEGAWRTATPGPVRFRLELNGQPYSTPLLRN